MTVRPLDDAERRDWLRLARSEAVGAVTFTHLIGRYGEAGAALAALPELARRGGRARTLEVPAAASAERELSAGAALGARLIASCEPDFPRPLAVLDPPPPLIWVLGDAALLGRRLVAIVGARAASAGGSRFAKTLAADLGAAGYVVVSGMARGIDAAAHAGALATGTIAVMAGGIDDIYPPDNAGLYAAIRAAGCLVSERAVGHAARAADFPRRNRLISGLSMGVIVVEAELKSGSLITARLAGEQGREVFAVPGSPLDPRARGANALLRQGAILVEEAADVVEVLDAQASLGEPEAGPYATPGPPDAETAEDLRAAVWELLSPAPTPIDEIARAAGAPISAVLAALMELALAGRAELVGGGLAART
ncbi:MAG TPA: DNA-processing protein DprA [Caulobacteraceae bacterium]